MKFRQKDDHQTGGRQRIIIEPDRKTTAMGVTAKRSLESSEDELLLGRANRDEQPQDFVVYKRDSRSGRLLGVVLSISGLLIVTVLVILINSRSSFRWPANQRRLLKMKEPISLREVLTGELRGNSFESNWLIEDQTGRDQLLFEHSGDLHLVTLADDEAESSIGGENLPFDATGNESEISPETNATRTIGIAVHDHLLGRPSVKIPLASNPKLKSINYQSWKLSPSRRFLLLAVDQRQRFRSTITAEYFVYDTQLDSLRKLKTQAPVDIATGSRDYFGEQLESPSERPVRFQVADWFSGPSRGQDSLLLVQDGDLYVLADVARRSAESASSAHAHNDLLWTPERLTFTGQPGTIYNGLTDWPYEEQLTGAKPAYAISPAPASATKNQYLAYFSFNDSRVSEIPMVLLDDNTARPDNVRLRFPTAGTPITSVRLHMIENFAGDWLTKDKLSLLWFSRDRSESHVLICSQRADSVARGGWQCERSTTERAPSNGWLERRTSPVKLNDEFYLIMSNKFEGADVGHYMQVTQVSLKQPDERAFLTSGRKEVLSIAGIDHERSLVYYSATRPGAHYEQHLYVTSLLGLDPNGRHSYFDIAMSSTAKFFILKCNGPDVPRIELRKLVHRARETSAPDDALTTTSHLVRTIEDNQKVRDLVLRVKAMPEVVRLRVPIESTDYDASVLLLLPPLPEFEHDNSTLAEMSDTINNGRVDGVEQIARYIERMRAFDREQGGYSHQSPGLPMIVDVYGGPAPFLKTGLEYNMTWGHWYASSKRTVYAWIEGRGSALEGTRRVFEMFGRLGTVEIEDQIQVTRDLVRGHLAPLVNPAQVGIWGWSYGGYAAGMVLARDGAQQRQASPPGPGVFACGASFGAVTDWLYYDTLFSEMILRSPWKNERYDRHTFGDHLLPPESRDSITNQSLGLADRASAPAKNLRDDVNDRYRNSSLIEQAEYIRGKRYLLVSGLADDNVHIQHTLRLTKRLVAAGIPFEMAFYPNQRHSMNYNLATRFHMHNRLADFFARCFAGVKIGHGAN